MPTAADQQKAKFIEEQLDLHSFLVVDGGRFAMSREILSNALSVAYSMGAVHALALFAKRETAVAR